MYVNNLTMLISAIDFIAT